MDPSGLIHKENNKKFSARISTRARTLKCVESNSVNESLKPDEIPALNSLR